MSEPRDPASQPPSVSSPRTPRLDPTQLRRLVGSVVDQRHRYLAALDVRPSPLYLLDRSALAARSRQLTRAFRRALPDVGFYYAVKSNHHPDIVSQLVSDGFGLDVSSGQELELALAAKATDIVLSGPGKQPAEIRLAVDNADRVTVLLDSFTELQRLKQIAAEMGRPVRAGVRLTTQPGGLWRKFGIPLKDLVDLWDAFQSDRWVTLCGLQFHTSWNRAPQPQVDFLLELGCALAAAPGPLREAIRFVDVGGGYWPEEGEWLQAAGTAEGQIRVAQGEAVVEPLAHYALPSTPINAYASAIGEAVRTHLACIAPCRIFIEPGRWLCHDAMHLLLTVVDSKPPDLVITDAGTNAVGWERFETDYFPVVNLSRPSLQERPCLVLGSLCTPHDVWGYACFGEPPRIGDVLLIPNQGAYTYSLRQDFIKPLPEVVAL